MTEFVNGLIYAHVLDGKGGAERVGWPEIADWKPGQGLLWVHLDRTDFSARTWLRETSGLHPVVVEALLAGGTRPRGTLIDQDLLVFLRGINLNPGENPVDMVSIRMYVSSTRIVTVRRQQLSATESIIGSFEKSRGPRNASEFIVRFAHLLTEKMSPKLAALTSELEQMDADMKQLGFLDNVSRLAVTQHEAVALQRYLSPQRDALQFLQSVEVEWFTEIDRMRLFEITDHVTRYLEFLNEGRERASIIHEQVSSELSRKVNRNMYILSLLAGIFLPLDFLTGLLGVNVGIIPGADSPWAFEILLGGILAIAGVLFLIIHRLQLLRPVLRTTTG